MKYKSEPNMSIIDYDKGIEVFKFNNKGTYETDDPTIIEFMKKEKPHIKTLK